MDFFLNGDISAEVFILKKRYFRNRDNFQASLTCKHTDLEHFLSLYEYADIIAQREYLLSIIICFKFSIFFRQN